MTVRPILDFNSTIRSISSTKFANGPYTRQNTNYYKKNKNLSREIHSLLYLGTRKNFLIKCFPFRSDARTSLNCRLMSLEWFSANKRFELGIELEFCKCLKPSCKIIVPAWPHPPILSRDSRTANHLGMRLPSDFSVRGSQTWTNDISSIWIYNLACFVICKQIQAAGNNHKVKLLLYSIIYCGTQCKWLKVIICHKSLLKGSKLFVDT